MPTHIHVYIAFMVVLGLGIILGYAWAKLGESGKPTRPDQEPK